jgi:hypothetical protein
MIANGTITGNDIAANTIIDENIKSTAAIAATKVQGTTPSGGTANQVLKKVDSADYNTTWGTIAGAVYQASAPSSPQTGDVWVDSDAVAGVLNQNDYLLKADAEAPSGYLLKTDGFVRTSSASSGEASTVNINTKPWNMPWGCITYTEVSASDTSITSEEIQVTSPSFTAVANRRYKITYFEPDVFNQSAASYVTGKIRLTNVSGTILNSSLTQTETANLTNATVIVEVVTTLTAGATVIVGTLVWSAGAGYAARASNTKAFLLIEDIGPA